jgi:hypothetical protein
VRPRSPGRCPYILDEDALRARAGIGDSASNIRREEKERDDDMAMNGQRPDVTDEEIGMRTFQLRKARAVERATDRMRQGLGKEWSTLSGPEIEAIGYALGELWAYIAHSEWDDLRFSTLDIDDARTILDFARELVDHQRNSVEVLKDVHTLIVSQG